MFKKIKMIKELTNQHLFSTSKTIYILGFHIRIKSLFYLQSTTEAWRVIFFITVAFYLVEMLIYTMFGTGKEQPWNNVNSAELHLEEASEQTVPLKEKKTNGKVVSYKT